MKPKYLFNVCFQGSWPTHKNLLGIVDIHVIAESKKDAIKKVKQQGYWIKWMSTIKRQKSDSYFSHFNPYITITIT